MKLSSIFFVCVFSLLISVAARSEISLTDDAGRIITLDSPAERIVSLAPHITENTYSAGAGGKLVGVVEYSDYPESARQLPKVGSYTGFNLESIIALNPDLVIAWQSGNALHKIQPLVDLGMKVYIAQPFKLEDVSKQIRHIGILAGTSEIAEKSAAEFAQRLHFLREQYSQQSTVNAFYQVWDKPLQTLNGKHLISDVIQLCGGHNVFSDALSIAPKISVESVIAANPEAILASGMGDERPEWLDGWQAWPSITAVNNQHLFFIHPDLLQRHTVRVLDGAQQMCDQFELVRNYRTLN